MRLDVLRRITATTNKINKCLDILENFLPTFSLPQGEQNVFADSKIHKQFLELGDSLATVIQALTKYPEELCYDFSFAQDDVAFTLDAFEKFITGPELLTESLKRVHTQISNHLSMSDAILDDCYGTMQQLEIAFRESLQNFNVVLSRYKALYENWRKTAEDAVNQDELKNILSSMLGCSSQIETLIASIDSKFIEISEQISFAFAGQNRKARDLSDRSREGIRALFVPEDNADYVQLKGHKQQLSSFISGAEGFSEKLYCYMTQGVCFKELDALLTAELGAEYVFGTTLITNDEQQNIFAVAKEVVTDIISEIDAQLSLSALLERKSFNKALERQIARDLSDRSHEEIRALFAPEKNANYAELTRYRQQLSSWNPRDETNALSTTLQSHLEKGVYFKELDALLTAELGAEYGCRTKFITEGEQEQIFIFASTNRNKIITEINQRQIELLIKRFRLDPNEQSHLEYWDQRNTRCFHGYGGVAQTCGSKTYRVPTRIHAMMNYVAASRPAIDSKALQLDDFVQNLDRLRKTRPSLSNPFSFFTRSKATSEVYEMNSLAPAG